MVLRDLTDKEMRHINRSRGFCPDCRTGELVEGPTPFSNGQHFRCRRCGSEFLLGLSAEGNPVVWFGERLEKDPLHAGIFHDGEVLSHIWPAGHRARLFDWLRHLVGGA
jgi:hypothetical protein